MTTAEKTSQRLNEVILTGEIRERRPDIRSSALVPGGSVFVFDLAFSPPGTAGALTGRFEIEAPRDVMASAGVLLTEGTAVVVSGELTSRNSVLASFVEPGPPFDDSGVFDHVSRTLEEWSSERRLKHQPRGSRS